MTPNSYLRTLILAGLVVSSASCDSKESGGSMSDGGATSAAGAASTAGTSAAGATSTAGTSAAGTTSTAGTSADGSQNCPVLPDGPTGLEPLPTPEQRAYQRTEMTAFIHFGMATFDGTEQGNLSVDEASLFDPDNLDAATVSEWVSSLKAAGFRQAMLVTKHSTGFCLWPSGYTDYSVKSSPWMAGEGDVVKLFTDAMHDAGMRVALYLSPWDQTYTSASDDYETYFKNQLTELLTHYGRVHEIEFDGFNAPTDNVDWESVFELARELQPGILIWAGPEIVDTGAIPDLQWIGNETGKASRETSSLDTRNCGSGNTWCPYECNTSSRKPSWFWHPDESPMSLTDMQSVYFSTVGMNCTLNFNVPPSTTGAFDDADLELLQQFGDWYSALGETNLLKEQPAEADSTWEHPGFEADKAVDDDLCTYWAAAEASTSARLEVIPTEPITFNIVSIREPIELGERVTEYHIEILQDGAWNTTPLSASGLGLKGTVIGQRQLWQLDSTNAQGLALVIDSAKDVPAISEFSVGTNPDGNESAGDVAGGTLCPLPTTPLITDFTYTPTDDGTTSTTDVRFGGTMTLRGGGYVYPTTGDYPLAPDVTESNWHISGTVGNYSGIGLYFDNCNVIDASAYQGISFTISGSIGESNELIFGVSTLNDSLAATWINTHGGTSNGPGRCIPTSGTSQYAQEGCSNPTMTVSLTETPTVVEVLWSDFGGGSPDPDVATPSEITGISWTFPWTEGGTPYPIEIVIDDLSFIP